MYGGQPSPHKPRLVVSHSTCPALSTSPYAQSNGASKHALEDKVRHFEMQVKAMKLSEDNLKAHIAQQKEALDKSTSEL